MKNNKVNKNKEKVIPVTVGIATGVVAMIASSPFVMNISQNIALGAVTVDSNLAIAEALFGVIGMGAIGCVAGTAIGMGIDKLAKVIKEKLSKDDIDNIKENLSKEVLQKQNDDFDISKELREKVQEPNIIDINEYKMDKDIILKNKNTFNKIKEYGDDIGKSEER